MTDTTNLTVRAVRQWEVTAAGYFRLGMVGGPSPLTMQREREREWEERVFRPQLRLSRKRVKRIISDALRKPITIKDWDVEYQ